MESVHRYAATVLLTLVAATLLAPLPAAAGTITVEVRGDTVLINATLTANLTYAPRLECDWYEAFYEAVEEVMDLFEDVVEDAVEEHLRLDLGLDEANVTYLNVSVYVVKRPAELAFTPVAGELRGAATVYANSSVLAAADGVAAAVDGLNQSNVFTIELLLNFTLGDVPDDKILNATLSLAGLLEAYGNLSSEVYAYDWELKAWRLLASNVLLGLVNGSDAARLNITEHLVEDGLLALRIVFVDEQAYPSNTTRLALDEARLVVDYFTFSVTVRWSMAITGVANETLTGYVVNARWRAMDPEREVPFAGALVSPATVLFMDLDEFAVPLERWERVYNGTHTVFRLRVNATAVTEGGAVIVIDPVQEIVVPGYAEAMGDYIYVAAPTTLTLTVAGAVAAATVGAILLVRSLRRAAQEVAAATRRFVRRRL